MFVSLLALLTLPAPPVQVRVQAGQVTEIRVDYPASEGLLNRDAPSKITLKTPWGTATARPSGSPNPDPQFARYFGQVGPAALKIHVPRTARPGSYAGRLSAELFVCDPVSKMCSRKTLERVLKLQVVSGHGGKAQAVELKLD